LVVILSLGTSFHINHDFKVQSPVIIQKQRKHYLEEYLFNL
jgi:hypothetical protein